jgi:SWIM zinc finger
MVSMLLTQMSLGWNCLCPDHLYIGVKCEHIYAVELSLEIKKQVEVAKIDM